jgi:ATP-dependent helicase/nuclease subunit B
MVADAPSAIRFDSLLQILSHGQLVLVPHLNSARSLRLAYDRHQRSLGLTAWNPPPILAFTQWSTALFADLVLAGHEPRLLLNQAQEHQLWREVVAADPETAALGSLDSLADLARSAFALASAHNALPQLRSTAANRDHRRFADWAAAFLDRCKTRQYLSLALLNQALAAHLHSQNFQPPAAIHLVNFIDLTPSQQSLLEALTQRNTQLHHLRLAAPSATQSASTRALNPREELNLAARWVRNHLQAHPSASLAVILPNPAEDRVSLETAFRQILAPELENIAADLSSTPWEFTTGPVLPSLTLVADALDLIRWSHTSLPLARISSLLLSPYLGPTTNNPGDPETLETPDAARDAAALFDARVLRRATLLRPELDLPSLISLAHHDHATVPAWLASLHTLLTQTDLNRPRSCADWTELFREILATAGWPGNRSLTPRDFEATRAWESLLDLLATLDFTGRRIPFAAALQALEHHAAATTFQPPSTHPPIHILTPAEANGSLFDAAIFLRCTDSAFPPNPRPNPLLSWPLQQSLHMPGTDPAQAFTSALNLTQSLLASTSTFLFTSASENADGQLRPSPILAQLNIPQLDPHLLVPALDPPATLPTEAIADTDPLPPLPSTEVHGGARLLQLQAACGFLAFAELRLQSATLESRSPGFNPRETGSFLHRTLQLFWSSLQATDPNLSTRDALQALPTQHRETLLTAAIDHALRANPLHGSSSWDRAYLQLQKDRLRDLLLDWLNHELTRGPFTIVSSERKELIAVGPLTLSVRMDRIDRVPIPSEDPTHPAEGFVYVDYKTGAHPSPSDWEGPRPDDPQLPLYTLTAQPGELHAVLFAKVRPGRDAKWTGYQSSSGIFPDKRGASVVPLDDVVAAWRTVLTQLAEDFAHGRAHVSPKSFAVNCQVCAQRLLCRLDPASLLDILPDDDSDDDLISTSGEAHG